MLQIETNGPLGLGEKQKGRMRARGGFACGRQGVCGGNYAMSRPVSATFLYQYALALG